MPFVDSHCHIHLPPLVADTARLIQRAREQDVQHMLCVSVSLRDTPAIDAIVAAHDNVFASVGVHPDEPAPDALYDEVVQLGRRERIVAVGETGLDYYRLTGPASAQQEAFRQQIAAARALSKPLIIHTREAAEDTLRILKEEKASEVGGVMHCFTETEAVARAALELNFLISFSGIVTFKNAQALRDVAAIVPPDRLLIETDAPYLAPVPHRGQPNEPAYVPLVAQCLADIHHISPARIGEQTTANFFALFRAARPTAA
ncbi:MAG: TatD family hydrolase [Gammaproteobacteria bacterium]|nr:TatD family hydrolase [Gammaproteobacteria bacterium]